MRKQKVEKTLFLEPGEKYLTLQSLLKLTGFVETGGAVKLFLNANPVFVNGERENRRGRKLYPGDRVSVSNGAFIVKNHDC